MKHQYLVVVLAILIILFGYSYSLSLKEPKQEMPQEMETYLVTEEGPEVTEEITEELPVIEPVEEIKKEKIIKIEAGYLSPKDLNITTGTTVTWINNDIRPHKITDTKRQFYGDRFLPGESYSYTFNEEGTYYYFDVIFFSLKGKIIVEDESLSILTGSMVYSNTGQRMTGVLVLLLLSVIIGTYYWFKEK